MDDWGQAFDDQCRAEGLEVPEKTEKDQSNLKMEQNEENKGFKSSGIGRGGVFGGPSKTMNAPPPPQTSFGATSGTRIGGAFGSQPTGPDGRGAPIGSPEEGGNVISVGMHKNKSACTFTRGGGFGTNRSMTNDSPTSFKTNHEGGRFGVLAPKVIKESSSNNGSTKLGGSFGTSQNSETTQTSTGGSFGSHRSGPASSTSRSSAGGAFGSKSSSTDVVEITSTIGGSFGSAKSTSSLSTVGGSFGSSKPRALTGSSSDAKPCDSVTDQEELGKVLSSGLAIGGSFGASRSSSISGGGSQTASTVSQEAPKTFNRPFGTTVAKTSSIARSERVGGAFGVRRTVPEVPDVSTPPPPIVSDGFGENRSIEKKAEFKTSSSTRTTGGAFGAVNSRPLVRPPPVDSAENTVKGSSIFGQKENQDPTPKSSTGGKFGSNLPDESSEKPVDRGGFGSERAREFRSFGGGFNRNKVQETRQTEENDHSRSRSGGSFGFASQHVHNRDEPAKPRAPFTSNPPQRGGFHGGYRGGGMSGGQVDFSAGQGHPMGRGRGLAPQQFSQQRSTPPSYAGHHQNPPVVMPDPKFKFTKPQDETHEQAPIPADIALLNKFIQKEVKMMKDTVVDVQRQDPKSPLYSISSFRELRLKPEVLQALDTLNFQFPTRIQETALPLLLMEPPSNLIAQAQSGTGKTAAFVLTMLCRIDVNLPYPQCICLAPTLELAKQIGEVVEKMGMFIENLKIHYAIKGGNMALMRGRKLTEQIVIGTPGITRDYLQKYKCIDPSKIRCLVLDEADVMIYHQGFTDISTSIYNMVEEASDSVQSMLFSATYDEPVINFATKIIKNAIVVMLKREEQALPNIKQFFVQCACRDSKYAAIVNLYSGLAVASSVIFCHTKASVMWLFENMKARGHQVDVLHGDMTVVERADTIIRFKRGDFKVLITTNVFARGIDVAQVSVVINYDLPIKYDDTGNPMIVDGFTQPDCETYLHRIGRTGRFGKTGIAINFIDSEDSMNMINVLENHFHMKIARMDPSNLVELEAIEMA